MGEADALQQRTARSIASRSPTPPAFICASITFSTAVRCGNRLKRWKTIPTVWRSRARLRQTIRAPSKIGSPPTSICARSGRSSRFTQRISVVLPPPLEPMI